MSDMSTKMSPPEQESGFGLPFWQAARDHRLCLQGGALHGALQHPPRPICFETGGRNMVWKELGGKGTVYTYTVNQRPAPGFEGLVPYITAIIDLDEGARITANISGDPSAVHIGKRVAFDGALSHTGAPLFALVEEARK